MLQHITLALLLTFLAGLPAQEASAATTQYPGWRWTECRFQYRDGKADWTQTEDVLTIRCAARRFGLYGWALDHAIAIAWRESNMGQDELNDYSGACGVYQFWSASGSYGRFHAALLRVPRRFRWWVDSCFNDRSAILAAVHEMATWGFGAWGG